MKFFLLASFVLFCTASTVYRNRNVAVTDDGTILITSPYGRQVSIERQLGLTGGKNVQLTVTGPNVPTRTIQVSEKFYESGVPNSQQVLAQIVRQYQGAVNEAQYQNLLNSINNAVSNGQVSPQIYEVLENLDQQIYGNGISSLPGNSQGNYIAGLLANQQNNGGFWTRLVSVPQRIWSRIYGQYSGVPQTLQQQIQLEQAIEEQQQAQNIVQAVQQIQQQQLMEAIEQANQQSVGGLFSRLSTVPQRIWSRIWGTQQVPRNQLAVQQIQQLNQLEQAIEQQQGVAQIVQQIQQQQAIEDAIEQQQGVEQLVAQQAISQLSRQQQQIAQQLAVQQKQQQIAQKLAVQQAIQQQRQLAQQMPVQQTIQQQQIAEQLAIQQQKLVQQIPIEQQQQIARQLAVEQSIQQQLAQQIPVQQTVQQQQIAQQLALQQVLEQEQQQQQQLQAQLRGQVPQLGRFSQLGQQYSTPLSLRQLIGVGQYGNRFPSSQPMYEGRYYQNIRQPQIVY